MTRAARWFSGPALLVVVAGPWLTGCPAPATSTCTSVAECPSGYLCLQGQCRRGASVDAGLVDGALLGDGGTRDVPPGLDTATVRDASPVGDAAAPRDAITGVEAAVGDGLVDDGASPGEAGTDGGPVDTGVADAAGGDGAGPPLDGATTTDTGTADAVSTLDSGNAATDAPQPADATAAVDALVTGPDAGAVPACGTVQALRDDFTLAEAGGLWWDFAEGASSVTTVGGVVDLDFASTLGDAYAGVTSRYRVSLVGGAMRLEARDALVDAGGNNSAWFRFSVSDFDRVGFRVVGGNLMAQLRVAGVNHDVALAPLDPVAHRWWQLRESAGQVLFEVSPDGQGWTELRRVATPPFAGGAQVQIGGGHYDALSAPDHLEFAALNLGLPSPGWCPAHTYKDGFDALGPDWTVETSPSCAITIENSTLVLTAANTSVDCGISLQRLLSLEDSSVSLHLVEVPRHLKIATGLTLHAPWDGLRWQWRLREDRLIADGESPGEPAWSELASVGNYTWLRLRRQGQHLYFEARSDAAGENWTTLLSTTTLADFSAVIVGIELDIDGAVSAGPSHYKAIVDSLSLEE